MRLKLFSKSPQTAMDTMSARVLTSGRSVVKGKHIIQTKSVIIVLTVILVLLCAATAFIGNFLFKEPLKKGAHSG